MQKIRTDVNRRMIYFNQLLFIVFHFKYKLKDSGVNCQKIVSPIPQNGGLLKSLFTGIGSYFSGNLSVKDLFLFCSLIIYKFTTDDQTKILT